MIRQLNPVQSRVLLGLAIGIAALGATTGRASALTPLDLIQAPLNSLLGTNQRTPSNDFRLMNENLSGNTLNLCALTCGTTPVSGTSSNAAATTRQGSLPILGSSGISLPFGSRSTNSGAVPTGVRSTGLTGNTIPTGVRSTGATGIPTGATGIQSTGVRSVSQTGIPQTGVRQTGIPQTGIPQSFGQQQLQR